MTDPLEVVKGWVDRICDQNYRRCVFFWFSFLLDVFRSSMSRADSRESKEHGRRRGVFRLLLFGMRKGLFFKSGARPEPAQTKKNAREGNLSPFNQLV
jgi:hypothetical protein